MLEKIKRIMTHSKNNLLRTFGRRKRNVDRDNGIYEVKMLMADETSACKQLEYILPKVILDWLKHGDKRFHDIFVKTKADSYNAGMVDKLIDDQIDLSIMSVKEQYHRHVSAIKDILLAQKSRVASFEQRISNYEKEIEEIKEKHPDIPTTDIRYMSKRQKSRIPFYKKKWCLFVILGVSCLLDYTTISSAVDTLLTQNVFLSTLLSIGTAMLINVTPSIAGAYAKNKHADNRKFVLFMLGAIFTILFVILFGLRWATRDALFTDTSQLFAVQAVANENTLAELFMTILLSAEPALTSAMSFVFGFIGATEDEKEKDLAEMHLAELYMMKDDLEIRVQELKDVIDNNQNLQDEELYYQSQLELMEQYRIHFKEVARIELSQIVAKPEANGIILQREDAIMFEY